ncbi:MAG TPA: hypothetical protein V6C65_00390 [Allocoleopsis sp.]
MNNVPMRASRFYDRVRQLVRMAVDDRTVRRWRAEAFVNRKNSYTESDAQQIAEYVSLLWQVGNVQEAREIFAQTLEQRRKDHYDEQVCIDVSAQCVA